MNVNGSCNRNMPVQVYRAALSEAGFVAAWMAVITGPFLAGFAVKLNAGTLAQGVLASLPFLATAAQLVGAYLVDVRGASRRSIARLGYTGSRLVFLAIVPLAYWLMPHHPQWLLYAFLAVTGLSALLHHLGHVAWMSWLSHSVDEEVRGSFFGARNHLASLATIVVTAFGAWAAGLQDGGATGLGGYLILFVVANVLGLLGSRAVLKAGKEPVVAEPTVTAGFFKAVGECLKQPVFRRFSTFNLLFMGAVHIASPFFVFFFLQEGEMSIRYVGLIQISLTAAAFVSTPMWGSLIDHFGSRPIQIVTLVLAALLPGIYAFTPHENIRTVALVVQTLSGTVWAGLSLSSYSWLLKISPKKNHAMYLATFGSLTGLACGVAPLLGAGLLGMVDGWNVSFGSLDMSSYRIIFLMSFALRLMAAGMVFGIPEPEARSTIDLVRALGTWRSLRSISGLDAVHSYMVAPIHRRLASRTRPLLAYSMRHRVGRALLRPGD